MIVFLPNLPKDSKSTRLIWVFIAIGMYNFTPTIYRHFVHWNTPFFSPCTRNNKIGLLNLEALFTKIYVYYLIFCREYFDKNFVTRGMMFWFFWNAQNSAFGSLYCFFPIANWSNSKYETIFKHLKRNQNIIPLVNVVSVKMFLLELHK